MPNSRHNLYNNSLDNSPDNSLDRWLRFAPWVAGATVAMCVIALVVRVVTDAGPGEARVVQSDEPPHARPAAARDMRPAAAKGETALDKAGESSANLRTRHIGGPKRDSRLPPRHVLKEPATPSSKSSVAIYKARTISATTPSDQRAASAPAGHAEGKGRSSFLSKANAGPASRKTPAAVEVEARFGYRAPLLGGNAHTSFFGIEASGRRFVYVLDRSGSMGEPQNRPLEAAKRELLKSLDRLDSVHQFFVLFYNERPVVFNPGGAGRQLAFADDLNKRSARQFIDNIQAFGGTKHYEALHKAVSLRPDVIFLLTDGEQKDDLAAAELARLKRLNDGIAQIHVVQFAAAPYAGNSLVRLAEENGGHHTYKNLRNIVGETRAQ